MATVKKAKKYQMGGPVASKKKAAVDSVESEMFPGKKIPASDVRKGSYITTNKPASKKAVAPKKKMKDGGKSFPDLNKDGKITKADILKGRGVIAKKGAKVGKAKSGAKKMMGGGKCKYGC